jgi:hypothetical protein
LAKWQLLSHFEGACLIPDSMAPTASSLRGTRG